MSWCCHFGPNETCTILYKHLVLEVFFLKKWAIPGLISCLFSSFQYSCQYTNFPYKSFPMTGFEPRTSGVGSDRSINCFTFDQILQFYFFRTLAFWHRNYAFWSLQKRCCCELFDQNMKRSLFDRYAIDWTVRWLWNGPTKIQWTGFIWLFCCIRLGW